MKQLKSLQTLLEDKNFVAKKAELLKVEPYITDAS